MKHSGKQSHSQPEQGPGDWGIEAHPKPSQAEGERQELQPGEEQQVADPHVYAETPPKPSQAEGESDTAA